MQLESDELSLIFFALAHPVRRSLLNHLKKVNASVAELSKNLDVSKQMMTKHLKILEKAKLIERTKVEQKIFSKINPDTMEMVNDWITTYKELWQGRLDRLEDLYSKEQNTKENK